MRLGGMRVGGMRMGSDENGQDENGTGKDKDGKRKSMRWNEDAMKRTWDSERWGRVKIEWDGIRT